MNLREWLFKQRISIKFFSTLINVDRTYVHKWMKGTHVPSEEVLEKIRELSLNEVSSNDDLKDVMACQRGASREESRSCC